jgi:hypothetical protein
MSAQTAWTLVRTASVDLGSPRKRDPQPGVVRRRRGRQRYSVRPRALDHPALPSRSGRGRWMAEVGRVSVAAEPNTRQRTLTTPQRPMCGRAVAVCLQPCRTETTRRRHPWGSGGQSAPWLRHKSVPRRANLGPVAPMDGLPDPKGFLTFLPYFLPYMFLLGTKLRGQYITGGEIR